MRRIAAVFTVLFLALPLRAEPEARLDALIDVLALPEVLDIMRQEGLLYGDELQQDLLAGRGGAQWRATVERIYDGGRMQGIIRSGMAKELSASDLGPLIAFFGSDRGRRIVGLEVSARRALLDPSVDEASRQTLEQMLLDEDPRIALLDRFIQSNDLLDSNVVGALNANYAFYLGLVDGGAFPFDISEEQVLTEVWSQEGDIRVETEEWLRSYLAMAYAPLPDSDIEAYIAISETAEGQALNRALFEAFDVAFRLISRELGLAAAQMIAGEDI